MLRLMVLAAVIGIALGAVTSTASPVPREPVYDGICGPPMVYVESAGCLQIKLRDRSVWRFCPKEA